MLSNKFRAASFLLTLALTFVGLTVGWVSAANADEPGQLVECVERPLVQGKAGETVRECRVVKQARSVESNDSCDASMWDDGVRVGCTTVQHFGTRVAQ